MRIFHFKPYYCANRDVKLNIRCDYHAIKVIETTKLTATQTHFIAKADHAMFTIEIQKLHLTFSFTQNCFRLHK